MRASMGAVVLGVVALAAISAAAEDPVAVLLERARAARAAGRGQEALSLATQAVEAAPQNPAAVALRGSLYEGAGRHADALGDYQRLVVLLPDSAGAYNRRGGVHFKLGQIEASIADFDKAVELEPGLEPHHWQRGIAYYYAGRYAEGRRQFESHQTVNPNDVENAVWHFLCVARQSGVDEARRRLLTISDDPRVPMMAIYGLFRGQDTAEAVLAAARAGAPSPSALHQRLFYAHLYLGLYDEAAGDAVGAREHITRAVESYPVDHYMGDVARVHAARLRAMVGDN